MTDETFLLKTQTARDLYGAVKDLPIIDYHCHIDPKDIAEDRRFENITRVWLGGDHYKWRLLRANGVPEDEITGNADDYTKFLRFAQVLPKAMGNPMYHWCHLELKRYFGYDGVLNADTAGKVYALCNERLKEMTARQIIRNSRVEMVGTTDDPADSLQWHRMLKEDGSFPVAVCPTFRPDKAVNIEKSGFREYIAHLSEVSRKELRTAEDVKEVLAERLDHFCRLGCRATDHGLDRMVYSPASDGEVNAIFRKAMAGEPLSPGDADRYKTEMLLFLGEKIAEKGLVMQLHFGVLRNTNAKMFRRLGADSGFDCIGAESGVQVLPGFLNTLEEKGNLPKMIVYSLNPGDNRILDCVLGCFQSEDAPGKLQHGAAWWFNDTKSGMELHLKTLAETSLLGNFPGMLTDSRSLLSYTRHEYFRRILCNLMGQWIEDGEYPDDRATSEKIARDISYFNAKRFFEI